MDVQKVRSYAPRLCSNSVRRSLGLPPISANACKLHVLKLCEYMYFPYYIFEETGIYIQFWGVKDYTTKPIGSKTRAVSLIVNLLSAYWQALEVGTYNIYVLVRENLKTVDLETSTRLLNFVGDLLDICLLIGIAYARGLFMGLRPYIKYLHTKSLGKLPIGRTTTVSLHRLAIVVWM